MACAPSGTLYQMHTAAYIRHHRNPYSRPCLYILVWQCKHTILAGEFILKLNCITPKMFILSYPNSGDPVAACPGDRLGEHQVFLSWWRHQMETFSALLVICAGNSSVIGEFSVQRPVTRSFDVFFDLRLNKRLSKQSWGWRFETPSRTLWRHSNVWRTPEMAIPTWRRVRLSWSHLYHYLYL